MSSCSGSCCKFHVGCCFCETKQIDNRSKSRRNVLEVMLYRFLGQKGLEVAEKTAGDKSYKFFRESYIHDIYIGNRRPGQQDPTRFVVKARCYRSLRKNEVPQFLEVISENKESRASVGRAHCSCKGGSGGHCNHIFALLFQLNEYCCFDVKDIPNDASCTSLPQTWHIPRAASICLLPVIGTHCAKVQTDQNGERKRDSVRCKLYDARGSSARPCNV